MLLALVNQQAQMSTNLRARFPSSPFSLSIDYTISSIDSSQHFKDHVGSTHLSFVDFGPSGGVVDCFSSNRCLAKKIPTSQAFCNRFFYSISGRSSCSDRLLSLRRFLIFRSQPFSAYDICISILDGLLELMAQ